jgi:hypothetical protein
MGRPLPPRIIRSVARDLEDAEKSIMTVPSDSIRTVGDISALEIWTAVNRFRNSRAMKACTKLMQLLDFVVQATVGGESEYLKETTIGVFVFGRRPDYDPKEDTIVRSQAWRLRAKLRKYYAYEGAQERVIIDLPRGHYIPVFRVRE